MERNASLPCPSAPDAFSFQALVEHAEDIITVIDTDGRIAYDNPAVHRVLGYRQGELVGRNAFELIHADDFATAFALLVDTVAGEAPSTLTFRFQHRDGSWRTLESVGRLVASPRPVRLVITSRDVTDRAPAVASRPSETRSPGDGAPPFDPIQVEMLQRLARAAEFRDDATGQHIRRVGELSAALASLLGLSVVEVERIRHAAPLHDIGKIGIRDSILLKPGPLSPEELEVMRTHTVLGARLLARGRSELVRCAETIALYHHERWDGAGYPCGLGGGSIPLTARIVAIVDFFDALTHDRPYRRACPTAEALGLIESHRGSHFDPELSRAFLQLVRRPSPEAALATA